MGQSGSKLGRSLRASLLSLVVVEWEVCVIGVVHLNTPHQYYAEKQSQGIHGLCSRVGRGVEDGLASVKDKA